LHNSKHQTQLQTLRDYAVLHSVPIITEEGLSLLLETIKKSNPKRILEIGSAIGYSAIAIASHTNAQIITIERKRLMAGLAKKNIEDAQLEHQITVIEGDALLLDPSNIGEVDFIFIDAAKAQYRRFFEKYSVLLPVGGMIVTDNLSFHGIDQKDQATLSRDLRQLVRKINEFKTWVMQQTNYETSIFDIGDGMSISVKKECE
jgi:predicted O-methyltransferase YrrM